MTQATWTSPVTSRLLLEAGFSRFQYSGPASAGAAGRHHEPDPGHRAVGDLRPGRTSPIAGCTIRSASRYADNDANPNNWRASASYVTGAHNMKVGYQGVVSRSRAGHASPTRRSCAIGSTTACPNGFGYYLAPRWEQNDRTETQSLLRAGQWTRGRLTLQGGVRYDRAWSWARPKTTGRR